MPKISISLEKQTLASPSLAWLSIRQDITTVVDSENTENFQSEPLCKNLNSTKVDLE